MRTSRIRQGLITTNMLANKLCNVSTHSGCKCVCISRCTLQDGVSGIWAANKARQGSTTEQRYEMQAWQMHACVNIYIWLQVNFNQFLMAVRGVTCSTSRGQCSNPVFKNVFLFKMVMAVGSESFKEGLDHFTGVQKQRLEGNHNGRTSAFSLYGWGHLVVQCKGVLPQRAFCSAPAELFSWSFSHEKYEQNLHIQRQCIQLSSQMLGYNRPA